MISSEILRRYPFFSFLDDAQIKAVAMIGDEIALQAGDMLFETDQPASGLFLLVEGSVDVFYTIVDPADPATRKEFFLTEVNPGELFGASALVEPYRYTATTRAGSPSLVLKIDAAGLRALCAVDLRLAHGLMHQLARVLMHRLHDTRIQLAASRA